MDLDKIYRNRVSRGCYSKIARLTGMWSFRELAVSHVSRILRGCCGYTVGSGARSLRRIAIAASVDESWLIEYVDRQREEIVSD